jgi:competence protein ComEA
VPWTAAAQRVLVALSAGLLCAAAVLWLKAAREPAAVSVPDDPSIEVLLDLNRATAADLETLPGVGAALAARLAAYRSEHGPLQSVDDVRKVPGFGEKLVARLRPLVTVR